MSDEKRLFRVELRTWPAREISLLVFGFNEEDAEKEGWNFIKIHGWRAKIGKIELLLMT
ncbi:MAG: hypothetical protein MUP17_09380 [candidate division Zixibacteria bacterium]|nr:hypothetical protein [candidate division Zixibacteria bacterium]